MAGGGWRASLHWLLVMCTHLVTFYGIHTHRGRAAMDDFGYRRPLGDLVFEATR
ncbi:hypothetical protein ACFZDJ_52550 [Streptomyces sp. NPDC007896]|uniref:hypothetical protein n=1 Tax=Streptomyces sp. NPDC007896 TaxID=3364784 RepID=UPI0036EF561B